MQKNRRSFAPDCLDQGRLLGGLPVSDFLRDYWHKRPLLVRQAVPELGSEQHPPLTPAGLMALAGRDDAESRLVRQTRGRWSVEHGPFDAAHLGRLPRRNWSLLVSGVNLLLPFGDRLLRTFGFMPQARLDDLMVSYAPDGGGVGPHFDSYDVFLLQGIGRRRWEISAQADLDLVEGAPLRILRQFRPEQAWELEPGDLLYLPPRFAHNGVALGHCMTWSVGFRAPKANEIAGAFLDYLRDHIDLEGMYADPDLTPPRHSAELTPSMLERLNAMVERIEWDQARVKEFLGTYLSEPKPQVFFDPPHRPLGLAAFSRRAIERGLRLDPKSRLLFIRGGQYFINGDVTPVPRGCRAWLTRLADSRRLPPGLLPDPLLPLLHDWYRAGYIQLGSEA